MTREQIIAKWAGLSARERDTWVAEVVMCLAVEYENGEPYVSDFGIGRVMDEYSTDTSAAWAVLEHFPYVEAARIPGTVPTYGVRINDPDDGSIRAMTKELTFPEAICLAAIIAKLTEVSADVAV